MPSLVDVWRAVDPAAELVAGNQDRLRSPVRGVLRTRATSPILPPVTQGELLVVDTPSVSDMTADELFDGIRASGTEPAAVVFAGSESESAPRTDEGSLPVIVSRLGTNTFVARVSDYLDREPALLDRWGLELRLAMAEAALADPGPIAPAAVAGTRLRRGIAVARAGRLVSVHAVPHRHQIALDFTATFARLFSGPSDRGHAERRTRSGLWVAEYPVRAARGDRRQPAAGRHAAAREAVWLFDDVPFAAIDRLAGAALAQTLSALQRGAARAAALARAAESAAAPRPRPGTRRATAQSAGDRGSSTLDPSSPAATLASTLIAVARSNGRVAPAARALGVHRNTVLYRLRRASAELGIDPRRPDDAVRLLRDGLPSEASAGPRARDR